MISRFRNNNAQNTVVVTGAGGFIGSHLAERLLSNGFNVIGIDNFDTFYSRSIKELNLSTLRMNSNFLFIEGNIAEKNLYNQINTSVLAVFHLAAKAGVLPSIKNPDGYIETNIGGTQTLLDWMRVKKISKLIFASSSSVYGNNKKTPFSEADSVDCPISPYAFTKKACELMIHTYFHLYQINTMCLRLFTVYGERQRPDLAIHKFVRLISHNQPIQMYNSGETSRDYTYINDTLNGIMSAFNYLNNNNNVFEIINLGSNKPITLKKLVDTIAQVLKIKPDLKFVAAQPGDMEITFADIGKAKQMLAYNPQTDLKTGIENFVLWNSKIKTKLNNI